MADTRSVGPPDTDGGGGGGHASKMNTPGKLYDSHSDTPHINNKPAPGFVFMSRGCGILRGKQRRGQTAGK